jgi:hypothetical protein
MVWAKPKFHGLVLILAQSGLLEYVLTSQMVWVGLDEHIECIYLVGFELFWC